jgi:CRISPR/Cas system type I-B associated protein Csh2 (Cas7 group RAMP superfamily)
LAIRFAVRLYRKKLTSRPTINVYFATETGASKRYAEKLKQKFITAFNVNVYQMNE